MLLVPIFASYRNFKYFAPSHEHFSLEILLYRLANNVLHRIFPYLISLLKSGSLLSLKRFSFEELNNDRSTLSFVFVVQICFCFINEHSTPVLTVISALESTLVYGVLDIHAQPFGSIEKEFLKFALSMLESFEVAYISECLLAQNSLTVNEKHRAISHFIVSFLQTNLDFECFVWVHTNVRLFWPSTVGRFISQINTSEKLFILFEFVKFAPFLKVIFVRGF